jgi:dynein heavy chain, axonemal
MDPDDFTRKIEMDDNPWEVDQLQAEISEILKKDKIMREKLPENIKVSIFEISCKEMKEQLSEKYQNLEKNLIDMIAKKAKSEAQTIFQSFKQMEHNLKETPKDIEKLTEIREYIANMPMELDKMRIEMGKCFDIYKILEDFNYRFNKEDLDKRWLIFGSPKELMELVDKRNKELEKEKTKFLEEMKISQEEFKETIDNLERTIQNFHSYQDINKNEEVSKSCV